jgi:uncharacterized protein
LTVVHEIVRLVDASEHVDVVVRWLLDEWPDAAFSFDARRSRLLDSPDCPATLVALSVGSPCGVVAFARFVRDGDERASLFVDALYVHEVARGQGVGSALLNAAVAAAVAFESRLFVYTALAPWYQRRGWTVVQVEDDGEHFVLERSLAADPPADLSWLEPFAPHQVQARAFLSRLCVWAASRVDIQAIIVVGSFARGDARPDSDLDVLVLATEPSTYLRDLSWISELGSTLDVDVERYGLVTSLRAHFASGLEVEIGIAPASWASRPLDPGTEQVARDGIRVLVDRTGDVSALAAVGLELSP